MPTVKCFFLQPSGYLHKKRKKVFTHVFTFESINIFTNRDTGYFGWNFLKRSRDFADLGKILQENTLHQI